MRSTWSQISRASFGSLDDSAPGSPFSVREVPGGIVVGGYATAGGGFVPLADGWRDAETLRLELAVEPVPGDLTRPFLYTLLCRAPRRVAAAGTGSAWYGGCPTVASRSTGPTSGYQGPGMRGWRGRNRQLKRLPHLRALVLR